MVSWNVLVFGSDLESPFAVNVIDPSIWTLGDLKREISKKIFPHQLQRHASAFTSASPLPSVGFFGSTAYTEADLEVYYCEKKLTEGKPLSELDGMHNGVGVMVAIKPFIINVHCSNDNVSLQVEIPRKEFNQWTVASLRSAICSKRGFDVNLCQQDIIAFSGNILADSSQLSFIPGMLNNCSVTITRITQFQYPQENGQTASVFSPLGIGEDFASQHFFHKRNVQNVPLARNTGGQSGLGIGIQLTSPFSNTAATQATPTLTALKVSWTITVQTLGGSKVKVVMKNPMEMPIFTLRELVMEAMSVPTHKQRLTAGDTVLEDWDEVGGAMLVVHYPTLYDGATVYLVTLTDGIRVELYYSGVFQKDISFNSRGLGVSLQQKSLCNTTNLKLSKPNYINIHCPKTFKQKTLLSVMQNCGVMNHRNDQFNTGKMTMIMYNYIIYQPTDPPSVDREFVPSDDPVSAIRWMTYSGDCCTLGIKSSESEPAAAPSSFGTKGIGPSSGFGGLGGLSPSIHQYYVRR